MKYGWVLALSFVAAACSDHGSSPVVPIDPVMFTPHVSGTIYNGAGAKARPYKLTIGILPVGCSGALIDSVVVIPGYSGEYNVSLKTRDGPVSACVQLRSDGIQGESYDDLVVTRDNVDITKPVTVDARYNWALGIIAFDTASSRIGVRPGDLIVDLVSNSGTRRFDGSSFGRRYGSAVSGTFNTDTSGVATYRIGITHGEYWSYVQVTDTLAPDRLYWLSMIVEPTFPRQYCFCLVKAYPIFTATGIASDSLFITTSYNKLSEPLPIS